MKMGWGGPTERTDRFDGSRGESSGRPRVGRGQTHDSPPRRHSLVGYGVGVLATVAVVGLRGALQPWLGAEAPLVPFVLAVTVSAWIGGLGPGLLATVGSAAAGTYFFFEPRHTLVIKSSADRLHIV